MLKSILNYLNELQTEELSSELKNTKEFIKKYLDNPDEVKDINPRHTVGDLLIALESKHANISNFYTKNYKESAHFCKVLNQDLILLK